MSFLEFSAAAWLPPHGRINHAASREATAGHPEPAPGGKPVQLSQSSHRSPCTREDSATFRVIRIRSRDLALCGNEHIICPDRHPTPCQLGPDRAGQTRILAIERHGLELQGIDAGEVGSRPLAPVRAVGQLVCNNDTQTEIARHTCTDATQDSGMSFQQADDGIGVEQVNHPRKSSSGRYCSSGSSPAAWAKSSSIGPISASSQAQSAGIGSRITADPCRHIRTRSVSNR